MRIGSTGPEVMRIQQQLLKIGYSLAVDGVFGRQTDRIVRDFQKKEGLVVDGIVGPRTMIALLHSAMQMPYLEQYMSGKMVWIVMGHGGVTSRGKYTTKENGGGKFARHQGMKLHMGGDYFYEGHENRIVGWLLVNKLAKAGIRYRIVNQEVKDLPLRELSGIIENDIDRGASGIVWNIHSNATVGDKDGDTFADGIAEGVSMFVERGNDLKAKQSLKVASYWRDCAKQTGTKIHGTGIHRRDFWMLDRVPVPSVLEEWRFFDTPTEVGKILQERELRAEIALKAIKWALSDEDIAG